MNSPENLDPDLLERAVLTWTGYRSHALPVRDASPLPANFAPSEVAVLLPLLEQLEEEFYRSQAHLSIQDLADMGQAAMAEFQNKFPDLPPAIAEALAWCYTYDNR